MDVIVHTITAAHLEVIGKGIVRLIVGAFDCLASRLERVGMP